MPTDVAERRRARRRIPDPTQSLSRVRLRAGRELHVVDLSTAGALVEGTTRLLPGTHVDVHVTAAQGRVLCRARVVRCLVSSLSADEVRYRGALAFDAAVTSATDGYFLPDPLDTYRATSSPAYPVSRTETSTATDESVVGERVTA